MVAKAMQEVVEKYDTYNSMITQSPKASEVETSDSCLFVEPPARPSQGDLFEITAEFDLHSVMASTYHSMRPVKPKKIVR